ncbi:MAG: hypothetical protein SEPTF4163_002564 [Sporothrix epigloea]
MLLVLPVVFAPLEPVEPVEPVALLPVTVDWLKLPPVVVVEKPVLVLQLLNAGDVDDEAMLPSDPYGLSFKRLKPEKLL